GVPTEYPMEVTMMDARGSTEPKIAVETRYVAPGYFDVMRIPVLAGERCRERRDPAFGGVVVNRSFANTYFPGTYPIGHNMRFPNPQAPPLRILGVVADARETGINRQPVPILYACAAAAQPNTYFMVRTRTEPVAMMETIRRKLRELDPARSVYDM